VQVEKRTFGLIVPGRPYVFPRSNECARPRDHPLRVLFRACVPRLWKSLWTSRLRDSSPALVGPDGAINRANTPDDCHELVVGEAVDDSPP
jgi:hypothetical protein